MLDMYTNLPMNSAPSIYSGPQGMIDSLFGQQNASAASNQQLGQMFNANSNQILAQLTAQSNAAVQNLRGTNRANVRSIDRRFTAEQGKMTSDLINRGLGNATIQGSMNAGMTRAHSDAISGSRAAFGGVMYDAQMKAALAQSGLASQQLNTFFNGTNIGYPDMSSLGALFAGVGAAAGGGGMSYQTPEGHSMNIDRGPLNLVNYSDPGQPGGGYYEGMAGSSYNYGGPSMNALYAGGGSGYQQQQATGYEDVQSGASGYPADSGY